MAGSEEMNDMFLTDEQIEKLLMEEKQFNITVSDFLNGMKSKKGHGEGYKENNISANRLTKLGEEFHLIGRKSIENPLDFSVILGYRTINKNMFKLRRYNGSSHEHTNIIENTKIYGFHIHMATARYQEKRKNEEYYAEKTDRYTNFHGALQCALMDCKIVFNSDQQRGLL